MRTDQTRRPWETNTTKQLDPDDCAVPTGDSTARASPCSRRTERWRGLWPYQIDVASSGSGGLIEPWDEAVDLDAIFKKANSVCEAGPPS